VVAAALEVVGRQRQLPQAEAAVALLGSEHPEVREAAARTLEKIGRAQHVRPLSQTLQSDSVAAVRVAAAQALATLGGPFAASALSQALSKDPDSHVQHVARRGLERLGFNPP
jgi:HEAT repeat protein